MSQSETCHCDGELVRLRKISDIKVMSARNIGFSGLNKAKGAAMTNKKPDYPESKSIADASVTSNRLFIFSNDGTPNGAIYLADLAGLEASK